MKSHRVVPFVAAGALAVAALALTGCSKDLRNALVPNLRPSVRLTSAPFDTTARYFYYYRLNWIGNDPDGRIDHFVYTEEYPRNPGDSASWVSTTRNEQIVKFRAGTREDDRISSDFHTFAIYAVDNHGVASDTVKRSFFSYTVAPEVKIENPSPNHLTRAYLTPSMRIRWSGWDPDGQLTQKPVKYKYKLLTQNDFPFDQALTNPDSVRRFYAPAFAGWDSVGGDTTDVQFTNQTPNRELIFVVVAIDEAGAYSPIFSLDSNMLRISVTYAATSGPQITMYNEFFVYAWHGGWTTDREVELEVPFNQLICFNWFALPPEGADMESYRWRLGGDVTDETPRTDEDTDVSHWSSPSLNTTRGCVGPFPRDTVLRFYLEASDNNGLKSLAIVRCVVVKPTFGRPLGIVDDTRLAPDEIVGGAYKLPSGGWPTAAELDTFLYARGGVPWKTYLAGTLSRPGLFSGYDFDTVGTRTGTLDLTVPLAVLGRYRHVIWVLDAKSAINKMGGNSQQKPMSSLRYMNSPNRVNTLATFVKQGGLVWCVGGGCAYASLIEFDKPANGSSIFSFALGELVPGRFMYDIGHWRTEISVTNGTFFLKRSDRAVVRGDYLDLPTQLRNKSLALRDTFPPGRTNQPPGNFYQTRFDFEYLSVTNPIQEDVDPDLDVEDIRSTLDTLYKVEDSGGTPAPNSGSASETPLMTVYHGLDDTTFVFSGFSLWFHSRQDCVKLVDYVLKNIWNLTRSAPLAGITPQLASTARGGHPATAAATVPRGGARSLVGGGNPASAPRPRAPLINPRPRE